jgi:Zn finger protein HypA/HybF involved in hydrogenase expression
MVDVDKVSYTTDAEVYVPYSFDVSQCLPETSEAYSARLFGSKITLSNVAVIDTPVKFLSYYNGMTEFTVAGKFICNCTRGSAFPDFQISETMIRVMKITVPLAQFKALSADQLAALYQAYTNGSVPEDLMTRIQGSLPKFKCNTILGWCERDDSSTTPFSECQKKCTQDRYTCNFDTYQCVLDNTSGVYSSDECTQNCVKGEEPTIPSSKHTTNTKAPVYIAFGILGVFLVGMVVYFLMSRKSNPPSTKKK